MITWVQRGRGAGGRAVAVAARLRLRGAVLMAVSGVESRLWLEPVEQP
jgi:hypothetical protein